jgi:hypothetical protein
MPLTRKAQILFKKETAEGVNSNPVGTDAVLVFEPDISDEVDIADRVPAGPTLSRDFTPPGRKTRQITFQSDFRGNGDTSIPIASPDWGTMLECAGYLEGAPQELTLAGAPTGSGFQIGEIVNESASIRAIVLAVLRAGVPVPIADASGDQLIVWQFQGTLAGGAGTLTGESSGTTRALTGPEVFAAFEGIGYAPTSDEWINVTTGAWAAAPPVGVGEVIKVLDGAGNPKGALQIIVDNGSMLDIDCVQLWGIVENGDTLEAAALDTATVNAAPTMVRTPSATIRMNKDGRQLDLEGARGDFVLSGESGENLVFNWTWSGEPGTDIDALPASTSGLSTIRPPRLFGAIVALGQGTELSRLPNKSVEYNATNTVTPDLDSNSAGGAIGSNVGDRDPTLTISVNQVHSAFDFRGLRDAGTLIRFAAILGQTAGNVCGIVIPQGQIVSVAEGDADGVATFDVGIKARRILEAGDDELVIFQI